MWIGTISRTLLCLMLAGVLAPAHALTKEELVARLKAAGYVQIGDVKSTPEGTVVKAVKDGKDVQLLVDGTGQIRER